MTPQQAVGLKILAASPVFSMMAPFYLVHSPAAQSLNVCQSTFAYAVDNLLDEKTTLLGAIADATYSEVGYFYPKGDTTQGGTIKLEDRHARPKASSALTLNDDMFDVVAVRSRDDILNHVNVTVHPRKIDAAATTVLYELTTTETTPKILAGETLALTVFFRDATGRFVRVGATEIVTPASTTDYVGNTAADGTGADRTSSLTLTFTSTSNSATLSVISSLSWSGESPLSRSASATSFTRSGCWNWRGERFTAMVTGAPSGLRFHTAA